MSINAKPLIHWDDLYRDGTIAASATDPDNKYDIQNIIDYRPNTFWKGTGAGTFYLTVDTADVLSSPDALGLIGHNLNTVAADVSLESSTDNAVWTERTAAFTPSSDKAIYLDINALAAAARYWRLKIVTAAVAPYVGVVFLGTQLEMDKYPADTFSPRPEKVKADATVNRDGQFIGFVRVAETGRFSITQPRLTDTWVNDTFRPVWDAHIKLGRPFFFVWDKLNHPTEVIYGWIDDGYEFNPTYSKSRMSFTLQGPGQYE